MWIKRDFDKRCKNDSFVIGLCFVPNICKDKDEYPIRLRYFFSDGSTKDVEYYGGGPGDDGDFEIIARQIVRDEDVTKTLAEIYRKEIENG